MNERRPEKGTRFKVKSSGEFDEGDPALELFFEEFDTFG